MKNNVEVLLEKILEELSLLSVSIKSEALSCFYSEFLNTENRKKMYELFNGENERIGSTWILI